MGSLGHDILSKIMVESRNGVAICRMLEEFGFVLLVWPELKGAGRCGLLRCNNYPITSLW